MSVTPFPDWRLPGCGAACRPRQHDPFEHEAWGERVGAMRVGPQIVRTGPLAVDLTARTASVGGAELTLSGLQWGTLEHLARNLGRIVSADALVTHVWGPEFISAMRRGQSTGRFDRHMLRVHMSRLRAQLGPAGPLLATVYNRGYRLEMTP